MAKRNLLICFDAFGTLITPKRPIAQQYGEVARSLGHGDFTDEQVQESFKQAFKHEAKQNPNFGKARGMDADTWWTNIIHNTFQPLVGTDRQIHDDLAPKLLHRFMSKEGYTLMQGVTTLLHGLRNRSQDTHGRTVVGVVTNSDHRIPKVLASFGLRVSPLLFGSKPLQEDTATEQYDIDFTVLSYDVGHEKPDKRIFTAAEDMLKLLPNARDSGLASWDKVFVGDEYEKDVVGARNAGWNSVLINGGASSMPEDVENLNQQEPGDLMQHMRDGHPHVALSSLEKLAQWLNIR